MGMDCILRGHSENKPNSQQSSGGYQKAKNNSEKISEEEIEKYWIETNWCKIKVHFITLVLLLLKTFSVKCDFLD